MHIIRIQVKIETIKICLYDLETVTRYDPMFIQLNCYNKVRTVITLKTISIKLSFLYLGYYVIHAYFADYHKLSIHSLIPVCHVLLCFYDVISLKYYVDYFICIREEKEIVIRTTCEISYTGKLIRYVSLL